MSDINSFITDNEEGLVTVSSGVSFSTKELIDKAYRDYYGIFADGNDSGGLKKIFFRMVWVIFRTIIMSSDIDLKDLNIHSTNGKGIKTLALLKLAVHGHLLRNKFGSFVDEVLARMVWFGSCITKRCDGSVYVVDLRNYVTEPNIKNPQERSHAETVFYPYEKMFSYKDRWKENWTTIEDLWEKMQKENVSLFQIIEFWTWDVIDGKKHKVCKKYLDMSIVKPEDLREPSSWDARLELETFITPYKKLRESKRLRESIGEYEELFPYEQADFFECPGRTLAMGCSELLNGLNNLYQETGNNKRKQDLLGLRSFFIHKKTSSSNSLTQDFVDSIETGSIVSLDIDEDLQRMIIDNKTQEYILSMDKLYELMRLVLGVTAQGTGEELPGSTSATGVKANFATQQTTYDFVRERMHHFVQTLFMNGYFEDIINEITAEEMVAISGSPKELADIDLALIKIDRNRATQERYNEIAKTRQEVDMDGNVIQEGYVTWDEAQMLDDMEQAETEKLIEEFKAIGNERWTSIKKEMLRYLHYTIKFFVNNETFDKQTKLENYRMLLADPNFTGSRQAVQDAIFDLTNENPRQFDKTESEKRAEAEMIRQQTMEQSKQLEAPSPITL